MMESEQLFYNYLISNYNYSESDITFRSKKTPDFVTSDGLGWEVKKETPNGRIEIRTSQIENMDIPIKRTYLVKINRNNKIYVFELKDVMGKNSYGIKISWEKPCKLINVSDETYNRLDKLRKTKQAFDGVLIDLLDEVESERDVKYKNE